MMCAWTGRLSGVLLGAAAASVSLGMCGCNLATPLHEQTASFNVPHEAPTGLKVTTRNGSVRVEPWAGVEVSITAHLQMETEARLEETTIVAERTEAGVLEVAAIPPEGAWRMREGCSFRIQVPEGGAGETPAVVGVEIRTGNGRIEIAGMGGEARLITSNGRITVSAHEGPVVASTSNGSITIRQAVASVKAHTSNGSVNTALAESCRGPLDIKTSNGSVSVEIPGAFAGKLELRTSNGSLRIADGLGRVNKTGKRSATVFLTDAEAPDAPVSTIRTSNGSITVKSAG